MKPLHLALFVAVGLVQLAVPGAMIFQQEQTLRLGTEYKFETRPVDPYDFFRGRYVSLGFTAETTGKKPDGPELEHDSKVYVAVKPNKEGFAEVERVSATPIEGENVFLAKLSYGRLEFPFNKYFMEETRAPDAENAYRKAIRRDSTQKAWAVVRIRNRNATLADLFIDGQPIREYLRDHPQPK